MPLFILRKTETETQITACSPPADFLLKTFASSERLPFKDFSLREQRDKSEREPAPMFAGEADKL